MTLATMADRSLPLATRVQAAYLAEWRMDDDAMRAFNELLADVAAADRLARAADAWVAAVDAYDGADDDDDSDWDRLSREMGAAGTAHREALDAYRARMAQGVGDAGADAQEGGG